MTIRLLLLYLDESVRPKLAQVLRDRGYDAVAAVQVKMLERSDSEQLAYAISQGRAILTFDVGDFVQLHKVYLTQGWDHFGIIVSPQYPIGETLRRTIHLLETLSAEEMMNRLEYLSQW